MLSIRYTYVRTILAVLALAFLLAAVTPGRDTATVVLLTLLTVAAALSWINPPGVFGWLLQGACPHCHGHVVWEIQQVPDVPYHEVFVVRCEDCGRNKIEFAFKTR